MDKSEAEKQRLLTVCAIIWIKFEEKFRYSIEDRKQDSHQIYDIQDTSLKKIRAIEFPGFLGV